MTGLYIALGIILFLALIMLIPVGASARFDEKLEAWAHIAFVRIRLYPPKPKKEKPKKEKKPSKKKEKPEEKKEKPNLVKEKGITWLLDLISQLAELAGGVMRSFFKHLVIKNLQISITYAGEDADETAVGFGRYCMAVYPAVSLLVSVCKCKRYGVDIAPNFEEGAKSAYHLEARVYVRVFWLIALVLRHGFKALRLLINLRNGKTTKKDIKEFNINNQNKGECAMDHPIGNLMNVTMEKIKEMVDVNTIIGNPITSPDGTLIIPVSKVSYGFASGGSDLPTKKENKDCFGGGSGAGITIQPVGFLTVYQGEVKLISVKGGDGIEKIAEMVPDVVDKVKGFISDRKKKKKDKKEEKDKDDFSEITVDDFDV